MANNGKRSTGRKHFDQLSTVERTGLTSNNEVTHRLTVLRLGGSIMEGGKLPQGRFHFSCCFTVPVDAPPSYESCRARTSYRVVVKAAIPWWPDAEASFWVVMASPGVQFALAPPRPYSSNPYGPVGSEAHIDCSLSSDRFLVGQFLTGTVAIYNVSHNRYRKLVVSLVARETCRAKPGDLGQTREGQRFFLEVPIAHFGEGGSVPFELQIPRPEYFCWQSAQYSL